VSVNVAFIQNIIKYNCNMIQLQEICNFQGFEIDEKEINEITILVLV
jgi:hypothetical protein